jgi:hypothetical protein
MSSQKKSPKPAALHIPADEKLPTLSHAQLVALRDQIKENASALRKAGQAAEARKLRATARKVRKLERATRPGAKKGVVKKASPKAKAPSKEEHLRKAA